MSLRIAEKSRRSGEGWWEWEVWLEGELSELDDVESVTYFLHPTFPEPLQVRTNREDAFRLRSSGWGEFKIRAKLSRRDGRHEELTHDLKLEGCEESRPVLPTIFVTSSMADARAAKEIRQSLQKEMSFVDPSQLELERDVPCSLDTLVEGSDALVAVVSEGVSPWQVQEIRLARKHGVPVIPVLLGEASFPEELGSAQPIRLEVGGANEKASLEELANAIKTRLGRS
jgi:hypothetical protein